MKAEITEKAHKTCLEPFGIRPNHVHTTIRTPDEVQNLEFGGLAVDLYMSTTEKTQPPTTLIAVVERNENNQDTIVSVYKTFLDALDIPDEHSPLDILEYIAYRFGITFTVLGESGKFFGKKVSGQKSVGTVILTFRAAVSTIAQ